MKTIYKEIWKLAKEYYKKGRKMDIAHVQWMMGDAEKVGEKENIDDSLLIPLVILHDVGYAKVSKENPYNLDLRRAHMKAGAKIAKDILVKVKYPKEKIKKIVYYVSVHDNWALEGYSKYKKDIILGAFNDLDFMWMATPRGFPAMMKLLNKNKQEILNHITKADKIKVGFYTKTTERLYKDYISTIQK
jgi:hypothetical protein